MNYVKYAAMIAAAWLAFKWLTKAYDTGSANLSSEGITGTGWAPPVNAARRTVSAWAPPYGIPHEGGAA